MAALAALAVGIGLGLFARDWFTARSSDPSSGPAARPPAQVTALGRLQPAGGIVPVLGPPGDRIARLIPGKDDRPIGPGTVVEKDQPLAVLASKLQRDMELTVARKQVEESETAVAAAQTAGRKKIEAAQAERTQHLAGREADLSALRAKADFLAQSKAVAEAQLARLNKLRKDEVPVADEDIEKAKLVVAQATTEHAGAEAALKKAEKTYEQGEKVADARIAATEEELKGEVARVPLASARERLKVAEHLAGLTTLRAPVSGVVLKVAGHPGQPTGMDPILQIAPAGDMVAVAEVYESDVDRLRELLRTGPVPVEVTSPSLPGGVPLRGRVESEADVSRMIARNQVFALGPREDADRRVVEVVVHLDPESSRRASRFVGLQVTVGFGPGK